MRIFTHSHAIVLNGIRRAKTELEGYSPGGRQSSLTPSLDVRVRDKLDKAWIGFAGDTHRMRPRYVNAPYVCPRTAARISAARPLSGLTAEANDSRAMS